MVCERDRLEGAASLEEADFHRRLLGTAYRFQAGSRLGCTSRPIFTSASYTYVINCVTFVTLLPDVH